MIKIKTYLSCIITAVIFSSCMQTRYITEQQIKNRIESHKIGDFSTIRTFNLFQGFTFDGSSYLEMTGYKYGMDKGLIIGADKYYLARQKFPGDNTRIAEIIYIELSFDQCNAIMTNAKALVEKINTESPKSNETVYHDYTVSKDLFVSYKKSFTSSNPVYLDLWIKGEKFSIEAETMFKKLKKFLNY